MPLSKKRLKVIFHCRTYYVRFFNCCLLLRFAAMYAIELSPLEHAVRLITLFMPSVNTSRTLNSNSVITKFVGDNQSQLKVQGI